MPAVSSSHRSACRGRQVPSPPRQPLRTHSNCRLACAPSCGGCASGPVWYRRTPGVRLAQEDAPLLAQLANNCGVGRADSSLVDGRTVFRRQALGLDDVFHTERNPAQGASACRVLRSTWTHALMSPSSDRMRSTHGCSAPSRALRDAASHWVKVSSRGLWAETPVASARLARRNVRRSIRVSLPASIRVIEIPFPSSVQRFPLHPRRSRFMKRRQVHAMLDGVFECRNHFFNIRWQFNPTLDDGPHRDRRGLHEGTVQTDGLEIVAKIRSLTAKQPIARLPDGPGDSPSSGTFGRYTCPVRRPRTRQRRD